MGIEHKEGGDLMYANIVAGKFAVTVDESVALDASGNLNTNYRVREKEKGANKGQKVYEFIFDSVSGMVDRFELRETQFGDQLTLSVKFDGSIVSIGFNAFNDSGTMTSYAASIGDQIGLVDFSKELKIGLSKKGGKVRGIALEQGGVYIPNSKDNTAFAAHIANRPAPVETTNLKGEKVWNWEAPSKWQFEQIQAGIARIIAEGVGNPSEPQASTPAPAAAPASDAPKQEEKIDDLPF